MNKSSLKKHIPAIFFTLSLALYAFLANILRGGPDFNDETEKLVGAMLITDGMHLYKDMFAHHGPFSYMIAHLFYWLTGSRDIAIYRFIPILFSLCAIAAIAFSPAIKKTNYRLFAAGFFALGLATTQATYGLMLALYQIYAGHLVVCVLALLVIPIVTGNKASRLGAYLSGLALGFTFFSAYSFVVTCGLLALICFISAFIKNENQASNKTSLYHAAFGALTSLAAVTTYLYLFGDIKGYGVFHFYFNQIIYAKFSNYAPFDVLHFIVPIIGYFTSTTPLSSAWPSYTISSAVGIFSFLLFINLRKEKKDTAIISLTYCALLLLGVIFTNPRSAPRSADNFQIDTLVIVALGFLSVTICHILSRFESWKSPLPKNTLIISSLLFISLLITPWTVRTYLYDVSTKKYYSRMKGDLSKSETKEFNLLRTIVGPDEKVQQFPYDLLFYIKIDRLPASGNYYYLPWQDKYFQDPISGYKIDVCSDMEAKLPKIIYYFKSAIWGYPTSSYLSCIEKLLETKYLPTSIVKNVWIRADITASRDDLLTAAIISKDFNPDWLDKNLQKRLKNQTR